MDQTISERYESVLDNIDRVCASSGRNRDEVKLVVVTKGQPPEKILEVVEAGAKFLGENYPEETHRKIEELNSLTPIQWHMIGHLQSRKIKLIPSIFNLIHSVDSLELATKLDKLYGQIGKLCPVLVEVNLSGEESKFGFSATNEEEEMEFINKVGKMLSFKNLQIKGLMTMPPFNSTESQAIKQFDRCRTLLEVIQAIFSTQSLTELSMGTSLDYSTAIRCGATYVRIGEAIMGQRIYVK